LYLYTEKYIKQNTIQYHETRQKSDTQKKRTFLLLKKEKKGRCKRTGEKKWIRFEVGRIGKNGTGRKNACM